MREIVAVNTWPNTALVSVGLRSAQNWMRPARRGDAELAMRLGRPGGSTLILNVRLSGSPRLASRPRVTWDLRLRRFGKAWHR